MKERREEDTVSVEMCFRFSLYVVSAVDSLHEAANEVLAVVDVCFGLFVVENWRRKAFHRCS